MTMQTCDIIVESLVTQAGAIRAWVIRHIFEPARARGEEIIEVRAGDVHDRIGLQRRVPNVCNVLGGSKLAAEAGVQLVSPRPDGPKPSAVFTYRILPEPHAPPTSPEDVHPPELAIGAWGTIKQTFGGQTGNGGKQGTHTRPSSSVAQAFSDHAPMPKDLSPDQLAGALVLVSCVKSKLRSIAPAQDLYVSDAFRKMRRIAERAANWRILSARHGLLRPDTRIEPYETTLKTMPISKRRAWARQVLEDLLPLARQHDRVILFAGSHYREQLVPALEAEGLELFVPMERLRQGEQLAWLGRQVARLMADP